MNIYLQLISQVHSFTKFINLLFYLSNLEMILFQISCFISFQLFVVYSEPVCHLVLAS